MTKTKRLLETTEMIVLRKIVGKTLWDRERIDSIRETSEAENINEWVEEDRDDPENDDMTTWDETKRT
ncbi:hypothetical protein ANN_13687 [Periplaneta americana]|uniref:Uncharacterized protein n=1 Tax=Periplaneta americana TaxID=6978 RepID=A0ABQ8SV77_PERAM|nr:hypothetical protein ANN_13687 [Periplaneta americana]